MVVKAGDVSALYLDDETAWLEAMAELIRQGRRDELDYDHLQEYLDDMAKRDRREVESRLVVLIAHVLKWIHQPDGRKKGWRSTIIIQRQELARDVGQGLLRKHAQVCLAEVYRDAVERAADETGIPVENFPAECPYSLDQLLSAELVSD